MVFTKFSVLHRYARPGGHSWSLSSLYNCADCVCVMSEIDYRVYLILSYLMLSML